MIVSGRWGVLAVLAVVTGATACGGGGTPKSVDTTLQYVQASGAVVGGQGKLHLVFNNPVSSDTKVTLVSLAPAVATLPTSYTVQAGTLEATVPYSAIAVGETGIMATVGTTVVTGAIEVVDQLRVTNVSGSAAEVGAPATFEVDLNIAPGDATDVMLTVANTAIATAPAVVHISEFNSSTSGTLSYLSVGTTTMTATLGASTMSGPITVVDHARIEDVNGTYNVEVGATINLFVELDAEPAKTTPITITSSNAAVLPAPMLTVSAGSDEADVQVKVAAAGDTDLVYTLADSTRTEHVHVVQSGSLNNLTTSGTPYAGQSFQLTASLDTTAVTAHDITLTSTDPTVVAVPSKITIAPGTDSTTVTLTALKTGGAGITATYNGVVRQVLVTVGSVSDPNQPYLSLGAPSAVAVGALAFLNLYGYGTGYATPGEVSLTSSDPTVLSVPAMFNDTEDSALVPLTALKPGTVTLTGSFAGIVTSAQVKVVATADLYALAGDDEVAVGNTVTWTAALSAVATIGSPITLTSSAPTVAAVPSAVYTDGTTSPTFNITGLSPGTTVITATMGTFTVSGVLYVGSSTTGSAPEPSVLSSIGPESGTIVVGASTLIIGEFTNQGPLVDTAVTITLNTPTITSKTTTVTVPAGQTRFTFAVTGASAGPAMITATVGSTMVTTSLNVVATPTFMFSANANAVQGDGYIGNVSTGDLLATLTYATSDANVVALTTTGTIAPGGYQATFGYVAKGVGTATITVMVGGAMLSQLITVTAPP